MLQQNKQFKFVNQIKVKSQQTILTAQISEDEIFLAIGGWAKKIQIFYLKNKKLIKNIMFDCWVKVIKFSKDSKILFSGDRYGYLHAYDITNNFKLIYREKVHQNQISDMITIDDEQILTSSDNSIQITNVKQKQQQSIIQNANVIIQTVEYDKSRNWIIYSEDSQIQFIDRKNGKIQFKHSTPHPFSIKQIQLFSEANNLVSSCGYRLYLWQIDDKNSRLIQVKQLIQEHLNFTSILNNSKLVVIQEYYVYILDNDLVIIKQINHRIQDFQYYLKIRQLNSLSYIIVPGEKNLQVLKRK